MRDFFDKVKKVVDKFVEDEAKSIREAKGLMGKKSIKIDLAFIKSYLYFLPESITRLEESGLTLVDSLAILDEVKEKINSIPAPKGKVFKEKLKVLCKNSSLKILQEVAKAQSGISDSMMEGWSVKEVAELKFCPVTSVDVERSFSVYKHILDDRRQGFLEENLEKIVVCNTFYARGK